LSIKDTYLCVGLVISALMTCTSHHSEAVLGVLVVVFHLDHFTRDLRFACAREVSLVVLSGVARPVPRPPHRERPLLAATSSQVLIHAVCPLLRRAACPLTSTPPPTKSVAI
jgi:hypothetical protein